MHTCTNITPKGGPEHENEVRSGGKWGSNRNIVSHLNKKKTASCASHSKEAVFLGVEIVELFCDAADGEPVCTGAGNLEGSSENEVKAPGTGPVH